MKKTSLALLLPLTLLAAAPAAVHADEVALMQFRLPNSKELKSVAIEFYEADAPATVANFKKLARDKFYNGLAFHRAFPHVLVQIGDPFSKGRDKSRVGTGGPGYTVQPEIRRKHTKGAVAMARLPDKINPMRLSNGSQFYVCLAPIPSYDGQYTVFGQVLYGLEVLDAVSTQSVDSNDSPVNKITLKSLRILPREKIPAPPQAAAPVAAPGTAPAPVKKPWWKIF